jgi:hypothetical protein
MNHTSPVPTASKFPLLIKYEGNEVVKVMKPEDIMPGRGFIVIETNYQRDDLVPEAEAAWMEDKVDGTLDD